ncbi:MAG: ATP/GTP-binding protein [Gammaproteobacteria bacterium]|nr:ATP/GTP-binding protein [Gammaproteobacteria bacterium]MDH5630318.1 ATP/GTP-binding protein [Gammaproteobacteria bacterium]
MAQLKIVFTGTVGAGKTQAVEALSEIPVLKTDVQATDEVVDLKDSTTIAMDYGEMAISDGETLAVYGTPGQKRFAYMWDILSRNALGIVILVNNSRKDPIEDLCVYVNNFKQHIENTTAVFGVTHLDKAKNPAEEMNKYYTFFEQQGYHYPVFPVDARKRNDVNVLVESLLAMLEVG